MNIKYESKHRKGAETQLGATKADFFNFLTSAVIPSTLVISKPPLTKLSMQIVNLNFSSQSNNSLQSRIWKKETKDNKDKETTNNKMNQTFQDTKYCKKTT